MYAKFKCMSFATILFKKNIIKNSNWCYLDMENLLLRYCKRCRKNVWKIKLQRYWQIIINGEHLVIGLKKDELGW